MPPTAPNPYLKTKVMTASREELRLMLYDGALRFCAQARAALGKRDFAGSCDNMMKAQKIVLELSTSLDHKIAPELCSKLSSLYTYIYKLLVDANLDRDAAKLDESVKLLEYVRETWVLLMRQLGKSAVTAGNHAVDEAPRQTAMSSLSLRG